MCSEYVTSGLGEGSHPEFIQHWKSQKHHPKTTKFFNTFAGSLRGVMEMMLHIKHRRHLRVQQHISAQMELLMASGVFQ